MQEKDKSRKIIIIVVIVALLAVISAMGAVIYRMANEPEETQAPETKAERRISEGLVVDGNIDEKQNAATFTTDMNMIWTFPSGSAVSNNAVVGNSELNKYECYFEVYLEDEEQTLLYSSPVIPVGKRIGKIELNQSLPDGTYNATCTYHILDDEDPDVELGNVSFALTLIFM